jgi:phospholipid transport system substrate-binding protein
VRLIQTIIAVLSLTLIGWSPVLFAEAVESPVELLERTSQQVIQILRDDKELLEREPERVYKIVDDYILPHLDDVTMAKLALGKNWRKATKKQKIAFVKEFRNLLVRTYSKSLIEFSDLTINYFPLKLPADAKKTSVKAEVIQPGGPSIPLVYRMRLKNNAWMVYDVKIDGISLVTSYRGTFTQEIRKSGIDGLLKYMAEKNNKLATPKQDVSGYYLMQPLTMSGLG